MSEENRIGVRSYDPDEVSREVRTHQEALGRMSEIAIQHPLLIRKREDFLKRARAARASEGKLYAYCSCRLPAPDEQHECHNCGRKIEIGIRCTVHNRVICEECDHDGHPRRA